MLKLNCGPIWPMTLSFAEEFKYNCRAYLTNCWQIDESQDRGDHVSAKLGYIFIAPALVLVIYFFLTPVILTGVFSLTNMSTSTGITGGSYQTTPSIVRSLADQGFDRSTLKHIGTETYVLSERGLQAAAKSGTKQKRAWGWKCGTWNMEKQHGLNQAVRTIWHEQNSS